MIAVADQLDGHFFTRQHRSRQPGRTMGHRRHAIEKVRGMTRSGLGRESGIEAMNEYLETKSVFISTADRPPANVFVMR